MGTKVQLKSYLPEFHTMRDLNEDADSSWSQYYGDRAPVRQLYGHSQQGVQCNRLSGRDRENIKQTILQQNATFKSQVYELHRVYNKQKELMDELMKKGPYGYLEADTPLSNSYSAQFPSIDTNNMRHIHPLPSTSASCDMIFSSKNLNGTSAHSVPVLSGNGYVIDSTRKINSRKTFDLELPAEVYINCEDTEKLENKINKFAHTVGTSESFNFRGDSWKSNSRCLADLNEPIKESIFERTSASASYNFLSRRTGLEENQGHQLPTRSNQCFPSLQCDFFKGRHNEEGSYSNPLHVDEEIRQEFQFLNTDPGRLTSSRAFFTPYPSKENFSRSYVAPQLKFKQPLEFLPPNQSKIDIRYQQNQVNGIDISGGYAHYERPNPSSLFSSLTKPSNGCAYIPLPDFNRSCDNWRSNGNSSYHLNGSSSISFAETNPSSKVNDVNLNQCDTSPVVPFWLRNAKNESSNGLNSKKIFGFTISDKTEQEVAQKHSVSENIEQIKKDENISRLRSEINLNSDPLDEDEMTQKSDEASAKEAAENILWMFSRKDSHSHDNSDHFDTLKWFAEVIEADAPLDQFEQETLELRETEPEEIQHEHIHKDKDEDDDNRTNIADALLFTKPRRGPGRKRRQKRDFQADILPGLVSLSRHEVTEDLQMISGMMKASGQCWQYGVTRRTNSRTRRCQRPKTPPPSPPPPPVPDTDIVGWGRTTRRCRRQRCPVTNVATSIT